jgi:hypothetical protein
MIQQSHPKSEIQLQTYSPSDWVDLNIKSEMIDTIRDYIVRDVFEFCRRSFSSESGIWGTRGWGGNDYSTSESQHTSHCILVNSTTYSTFNKLQITSSDQLFPISNSYTKTISIKGLLQDAYVYKGASQMIFRDLMCDTTNLDENIELPFYLDAVVVSILISQMDGGACCIRTNKTNARILATFMSGFYHHVYIYNNPIQAIAHDEAFRIVCTNFIGISDETVVSMINIIQMRKSILTTRIPIDYDIIWNDIFEQICLNSRKMMRRLKSALSPSCTLGRWIDEWKTSQVGSSGNDILHTANMVGGGSP